MARVSDETLRLRKAVEQAEDAAIRNDGVRVAAIIRVALGDAPA